MWLASCYYHLAEFDKAKEIDSTNSFVFPIDRNKTVLSDKYSLEGNELVEKNKIEKALECYYKCANLEKKILEKKVFHMLIHYLTYIYAKRITILMKVWTLFIIR